MKKYILLLGCTLILVTGCGKQTTTECTYQTNLEGININGTITIKSSGKYIDSVENIEIANSTDENALQTLKESVDATNAGYNGLKGIEFSTNIENGVLTSIIKTDYKKIDMDKYSKINTSITEILDNGKIKTELFTEAYENVLNATCKEI